MAQKLKNNLFIKTSGWEIGPLTGGGEVPEKQFDKSKIFLKEFSNFGRLDRMSKAVCSAIALVLRQIDLYPIEKKLSIPLFFSNPEGTLYSDAKYYRDFLEFDQTSGRANLFVYTLPTSPLGEASVHFGLTGNISYITSETPLKTICETVMNSQEDYSDGVLIGLGESGDSFSNALFLYLNNDGTGGISIKELSEFEFSSVLDLKERLLTD